MGSAYSLEDGLVNLKLFKVDVIAHRAPREIHRHSTSEQEAMGPPASYWATDAIFSCRFILLSIVSTFALLGLPPTVEGQTLTVLHSFGVGAEDIRYPVHGVRMDAAGNFYGV